MNPQHHCSILRQARPEKSGHKKELSGAPTPNSKNGKGKGVDKSLHPHCNTNLRKFQPTRERKMIMKMAFIAALAAIGDFLGTVLAYALAALTAGGMLLLFVCIIAEKDKEKRETAEDGK